MANYITTDTELTYIANAIRTKGGTSSSLSYPSGFVSAIEDISTTPKLQDKIVTLNDINPTQTFGPGDNIFAQFYESKAYQANTPGGVTIASLIQNTFDNSKKYEIRGTITITDSNNDIIHIITINQVLNTTQTNNQTIQISTNDYFSDLQFKWEAANKSYSNCIYFKKTGNFGFTISIVVTENEEEYEGLNTINVNVPKYLNIYKNIATRIRINYDNQNVKDYCNSFSIIKEDQFRGYIFEEYSTGSIVFQNVSYISVYGFAGTRDTTFNGYGGQSSGYHFYFPALTGAASWAFTRQAYLTSIDAPLLSSISAHTFQICHNLSQINFPSCTYIGELAFTGCSKLTSVTFPVCESIYIAAFSQCGTLEQVNFPECSIISGSAFYYCSHLTSISFPKCTSIGVSAFYRCSSLTSVYFPECLSIGDNAFNYCTQMTVIDIPKCTYIGPYAFYFCSALTTVSASQVTTIQGFAFSGCSSLEQVDFQNCISIQGSAFVNCSALSTVNLPVCTSFNGTYIFSNCSALTSINLPECTLIPSSTFYSCIKLSNISIPKVSKISGYAFRTNYALSTISIPACTMLEGYAFQSCYNLLSIYLLGSSYVSLQNIYAFVNTPISTYTTSTGGINGSIYVPSSMLDTYKTMTNWATYSSRFVGV